MSFLNIFEKPCLIGAHRGERKHYPENTLCALEAAVGRCDFIEVDTQLSKDGVAIIIHDATLTRKTNAQELFPKRAPFRVCDFTFDELASLDYGSHFNKQYAPLLTLQECLKFVKEKQIYLNLEIKDIHHYFQDTQVIETVLKEIDHAEVEELLLLSSFRHSYLKRLGALPTAALVEGEHPKNLLSYLKNLEVDAYNFNNELVDTKTLHMLKEAGFFVNIYTINNFSRAKELFKMGVNGIFTDDLDKMAPKRFRDANI